MRLWPFAPKRTRGNAALGAICELKIPNLREVESICQQFIDDLHNEIKATYPETGEGLPLSDNYYRIISRVIVLESS